MSDHPFCDFNLASFVILDLIIQALDYDFIFLVFEVLLHSQCLT